MFLYIWEKLDIVIEFSVQAHCTGLCIGINSRTKGIETIIGLWSEKLSSLIVKSETDSPCVKIKSSVRHSAGGV